MRALLIVFAFVAATCALVHAQATGNGSSTNVYGNMGNPGASATASAAPQLLQAYGYNCGTTAACGGQQAADLGAAADQVLFWGMEPPTANATINAQVTVACTGPCTTFVYDEPTELACTTSAQTPLDAAYWTYVNATQEASIYHQWGGGTLAPTNTSRQVKNTGQGQCNATGTGTGGTAQLLAFNPADTVGTQCFYNFLATSSAACGWSATGPYLSFAQGEGMAIDAVDANIKSQINVAEFGNTHPYDVPQGTFAAACGAWWACVAHQMASLCQTTCIPLDFKIGEAAPHWCDVLSGGFCITNPANQFAPGTRDIRLEMQPFCLATPAPNNVKGMLLENPVDRDVGASDFGTLAGMTNTISYDQAHDQANPCGFLRWPTEETAPASFSQQLGWIWMNPRPSTGIPDLIPPWRTTGNNGTGSTTDVPYWVDYEVVPQGPRQTPAPLVWNGTTPTSGTWCDSATPGSAPNAAGADTGGWAVFTVFCPKQFEAVTRIQYDHCWSLGTDHGPCAAVVNNSDTAEVILSTWFGASSPGGGPPASTYAHVITFKLCNTTFICEGAYIPVGYTGPDLAALNTLNATCLSVYCIGAANQATGIVWTNTFTAGTTPLPAFSTVFLVQ